MTLVRGSVAVDEDGVVTGTGYALELFNMKMADLGVQTYLFAVPDVPTEAPPLPPAQALNTEYELKDWLDQFPTLDTAPPKPPGSVSAKQAQAYINAWIAAFIAAGHELIDVPPLPPAQNLDTAHEWSSWFDQFPQLATAPPKPTGPVSVGQAQAYIDDWTAAFIAAGQELHDRTLAMNARMDLMVKVAFAKAANTESFVLDYLKANAVIPAGIPVETTGDESAQSGSTTGPGSLT